MPTDTFQDLCSQIQNGEFKHAVITTHHKPDGDAMGSSLGLFLLLKNYIPNVQVITPTDYADFLNWLPKNETVKIYEGNEMECDTILTNAEIIFCLDFNSLSRINEMGLIVEKSKAKKAMIDHHQNPENFAEFVFWNTETSSTCELVLEMILTYFSKDEITSDIANCLYTGTMTDTGCFQHGNTTAKTHRNAAILIERGATIVPIHQNILDVFSPSRSRLFGYCLYKKMELLPEINTALMYLTREELQEFDVKTGDTEGLVNFGLSIKGIKLSVLIIDRTKMIKMSFRSKGEFAVNEFAAKHFNGGGHKNAAGGQSSSSLMEVVHLFKKEIYQYQKELKTI